MAAVLPHKLSTSLVHLVRRVRTIRILRAVTFASFVVPLVALACIVADAYFQLATPVRIALFIGWLGVTVWTVWRGWRAAKATVTVEDVACAIEAEYPRLAERLTTAVELAEHSDASNGSPELIEEVIRDADVRVKKLNLESVFPRGGAVIAFLLAVIVLTAVVTPVFMDSQAGEYVRRFFAAWYNPAPVVNYRVSLTSGDEFIKRGDPVTLTAIVEATKPNTDLPTTATLVMVANGKEERLSMTGNEDHIWHVRRPAVEYGFEYRVEAGQAVSETKRVTVVEPIVLASAKIRVQLPAYAQRPNELDLPIEGLGELAALEHSTIIFNLRFHPKPTAATIVFTGEPNPDKKKPDQQRYMLKIADDGSTTLTVPAKVSGTFQLTAEGDHKVKSEFPPQPLRVHKDEAPRFPRVSGLSDKPREIRPTEKLTIECTTTDDVAVDKLVLQIRFKDGNIEELPLQANNLKTPLADGRIVIDLKERLKGKDAGLSDVLACRLAATDNCVVTEANLKPHTAYFPAKDWAEFRINPNADPLAEQDILAKKREIANKLKDIRADLMAEARTTDRLKADTQNRTTLTPDNQESLKALRREVDETASKVEELARDTSVTPELKRLAEAIRQLADRELRDAEAALDKARDATKASDRTQDFKKANEALNEAIKRTDELLDENDKAAKERLEQLQLQDLAQQQQDLADATRNADPKDADALAKKQRELDEKLKKLADQSEPIKRAIDALKADDAKKLADEAKRIADEMKALNEAMHKGDKNSLENRLAELKKKQDELAKKARELADKTDTATRVAQKPKLQADDAEAAKNALAKGNLDVATKEQEKARQELERLARDLEKAAADARDPREAALQLARLQEDLRQRFAQATQKTPLQELPKEQRQRFEKEQEAIERAAKSLKAPANDNPANVSKQRAAAEAEKAREMLENGAQAAADAKMKDAKDSLERLAAQLPTKDERAAKARNELAELKKKQDELRQHTETVVRNGDRTAPDSAASKRELAEKLSNAAKQQADLADKLSKLDAPGQDARRDQTTETMQKAATDMTAGRPQDVIAGQQAVKRELERLEQALNGQTPADEQLEQLTRKQKALAAEAAKNAQNPDKATQADLAKRQGELARELERLQTPEAATAQADATDAAKKAEAAGRENKPDELAKKAQEAAAKTEQLNERVNGKDKDAADTAERLAKKQRDNATEQEKRKDGASTADARKKAGQEAEELKNLRAGPDAQKAKQQAQDALQRAANTLEPNANAQAQKEAAQALEQLAEQLTRAKKDAQAKNDPAEAKEPGEDAEQLGKKQRDLAEKLQKEMQQAQQQGGNAGKQAEKEALQKAAKEQRDLAQQAEQINGRDAPKETQQAQEALRKAQEELDRENFKGAQQQQKEAADALDRLSRQVKDKQQQRAQENQQPNMPNQQLADEAKQLAEEQRKLRDEAMKAADDLAKENQTPKDNPVDELAKQQQQIALQAGELAKTVSDRQGDKAPETKQAKQAADAAKQTSDQVKNGELEQAKGSGKQTADALEQLAQANPGSTSGKKAQDLARQQQDINKKLDELAGNGAAAKAQQQARQEQLEKQARDVGQRLEDLAKQAGQQQNGKDNEAGQKAQQAAGSAQQSGDKMQDARQAGQKGQRDQAADARNQAADAMQKAAQQANDAAKQLGGDKGGSPQAGKTLQKAQDNMQKAGQELGQKQPGEASNAMEKAAQQLQQAAQQLQQGNGGPTGMGGMGGDGQPGMGMGGDNPGGNVGGAGGKLDLSPFSADVAKHNGKSWGELPGEIRTKLIQEMKARYGEDYARNIKLYFEQLAERK